MNLFCQNGCIEYVCIVCIEKQHLGSVEYKKRLSKAQGLYII